MDAPVEEQKTGIDDFIAQQMAQFGQSATDPLNQCHECKRFAGKYNTHEGGTVGIFLMNDSRGWKCCNLCAAAGLIIRSQKMNKSEKRKFKKMKLEIQQMRNIPHITLDAQGNKIT